MEKVVLDDASVVAFLALKKFKITPQLKPDGRVGFLVEGKNINEVLQELYENARIGSMLAGGPALSLGVPTPERCHRVFGAPFPARHHFVGGLGLIGLAGDPVTGPLPFQAWNGPPGFCINFRLSKYFRQPSSFCHSAYFLLPSH